MENGSKGLRERLLARLPQADNVAGYREDTESMLAKHERALFWEKVTAKTITWLGFAVLMFANSTWSRPRLESNGTIVLDATAGLLIFAGAMSAVEFLINRSKADLLKEIKQVQLQVLELQASLQKDGNK